MKMKVKNFIQTLQRCTLRVFTKFLTGKKRNVLLSTLQIWFINLLKPSGNFTYDQF
jgi:hypothetical protein